MVYPITFGVSTIFLVLPSTAFFRYLQVYHFSAILGGVATSQSENSGDDDFMGTNCVGLIRIIIPYYTSKDWKFLGFVSKPRSWWAMEGKTRFHPGKLGSWPKPSKTRDLHLLRMWRDPNECSAHLISQGWVLFEAISLRDFFVDPAGNDNI